MNTFVRARRLCGAILSLALVTPTVYAHHSTAQYDMTQRASFSGTVTRFDYQNPHAWIWLDVPQADGSTKNIGIECGSPAMLRHNGLAWDALKKGDKVTVEAAPFKDAQRSGGILVSVTWADGHKWGGKGPFAALGPDPASPSAPPAAQ